MAEDALDRTRALRRIADALGVGSETLFAAHAGVAIPSEAEVQALLAAFLLVSDAQARRRVINLAEVEARRATAAVESSG